MLIKDLFIKHQIKPQGILHIGAHEGQEAPIYRAAGVENVIWVEGNPDIYQRLMSNLTYQYPEHKFIQALVSDVEEEVDFNISSNDGQSSSILEFGTHSQQHPDVIFVDQKRLFTRRLDNIFVHPFVADFLVMDIQGMELRALKGMGSLLNQFKWVYLEVNREEVYKGCGRIEEVEEYLGQFGFKGVQEIWHGGWGDKFYSR